MIKAQQVIVCDEIPKGSGMNIFSPYRLTTKVVSLDGDTISESDPCSYPIEIVETMLMKMAQMYFNDLLPFKKSLCERTEGAKWNDWYDSMRQDMHRRMNQVLTDKDSQP